jgi:hypothetical protein
VGLLLLTYVRPVAYVATVLARALAHGATPTLLPGVAVATLGALPWRWVWLR